jgi:hypothetical protein
MKISSLYSLTENGVIYYDYDIREYFVPFSQIGFGKESQPGLFSSMHIDLMTQKRFTTLNAYYHLAAVIEKYFPNMCQWDKQMLVVEKFVNNELGVRDYFKAHGLIKWPKFYDDFSSENFDAHFECWIKSRAGYKSQEQIVNEVPGKIQKLIYDRSASDFINLDDRSIYKILNPGKP